MRKMSRHTKIGLVLGGYFIACLVATGVIYVYQLFTQAAAGMYVFGNLLLFVSVCGSLAIFPTGLAIYFLIKKLQVQ